MTDRIVTHNYAAYGLAIRSSIPLAEFVSGVAGEGEVEVTFGEDPGWISTVRGEHCYIRICRDESRFWFNEVGAFVVKDGSQVIAIPEKDFDRSHLRLYIQGMMMAMILHQRGFCVLHASVIAVHGSAVAFLGPVGAGKSSLAAALYSRGHRVLTDDNAAIEFASGIPMVVPSYPSVKLFPEIASSLGFRNGSLTALPASGPKVAGAVPEGFIQKALPLRGLYFLGRDYDPEITRVPPLQAALELIRNSVPTRWGHPGDAHQLQQCGVMAKQVPAFTLRTFTDMASLPAIAEAVENHLMEVTPSVAL
jgi:hypothetical protein